MKKYIKPEVNIVKFDVADIIMSSVSDEPGSEVSPEVSQKAEDNTADLGGKKDEVTTDTDGKGTNSDDSGTEVTDTPLAPPVNRDPPSSTEPSETPPSSNTSGENQADPTPTDSTPTDPTPADPVPAEAPVDPIPETTDPVPEPITQDPVDPIVSEPTASDDIVPMAETGPDTV